MNYFFIFILLLLPLTSTSMQLSSESSISNQPPNSNATTIKLGARKNVPSVAVQNFKTLCSLKKAKLFSYNNIIALAIDKDNTIYYAYALHTGSLKKIWVNFGDHYYRFEHDGCVTSAEFSPDFSKLLTTTACALYTWDLTTGKLLHSTLPHAIVNHKYNITSAHFCQKTNRIITAAYDQSIALWDAASGDEIKQHFINEIPTNVFIDPHYAGTVLERYIVAAATFIKNKYEDEIRKDSLYVHLPSTGTNQPLDWPEQTIDIRKLAINNNSSLLAACSENYILIWHIDCCIPRRTYIQKIFQKLCAITAMAFSHNNEWFVVAYSYVSENKKSYALVFTFIQ